MTILDNLNALLAAGRDTALLRQSLGSEYIKAGAWDQALIHLARAVELDPAYSAAWKLYGKALVETGQLDAALAAYQQGIAVAEAKGDIQAAKEMGVFRRRIERTLAAGAAPKTSD